MNREEIQMMGFEIVAYSGEATSDLMEALKKYLTDDFEEARKIYLEARKTIAEAHSIQTKMLQMEASGDEIPYSFTMGHGQDHLMSAVLLRDVIDVLLTAKGV